MAPESERAKMETVGIFAMNDCDWMAAHSLEEATAFYLKHAGMSAKEAFMDDEPYEVADESLAVTKFRDEDGSLRTFREELDRRIGRGEKFPNFFASTEG